MPDNFSTHLHYYVLLSLFALLFLLQIWAMIKIKLMLQRVLDIYKRMQQIAAMSKSGLIAEGELQPSRQAGVNYKRICEWCRHRETFLDPSGKGVFVYRCGLSKHRIKLNDSCPQFEFDPQRAPI
ncbi:hypothetical protein L0337_33885 [candidate division KSB1 bacterium]|nr:hypothetical protein [candidate division KSB1 bacterium]